MPDGAGIGVRTGLREGVRVGEGAYVAAGVKAVSVYVVKIHQVIASKGPGDRTAHLNGDEVRLEVHYALLSFNPAASAVRHELYVRLLRSGGGGRCRGTAHERRVRRPRGRSQCRSGTCGRS